MIDSTSRYANSQTALITSGRGTNLTIVASRPQPWAFAYTSYRLNAEDRLDLLAANNFGDGVYWWKIADANPEILDWTSVEPGTIIRIPSA